MNCTICNTPGAPHELRDGRCLGCLDHDVRKLRDYTETQRVQINRLMEARDAEKVLREQAEKCLFQMQEAAKDLGARLDKAEKACTAMRDAEKELWEPVCICCGEPNGQAHLSGCKLWDWDEKHYTEDLGQGYLSTAEVKEKVKPLIAAINSVRVLIPPLEVPEKIYAKCHEAAVVADKEGWL
jgi:hypothetical protein